MVWMPPRPSLGPCLVSLGLLLASCSPDGGSPPGGRCVTSSDCSGDTVCVDRMCVSRSDGGGDAEPPGTDSGTPVDREVVSIAIEPASASLTSTDGSMPEQIFTVAATLRDGSVRPAVAPRFELDSRATGDVDEGSGRYVANGVIGGTAEVTATVLGADGAELTATAMVEVRIERTVLGDGTAADAATRFDGALVTDGAREANVVYPLRGAVMPQNVYPAEIQWLTVDPGDVFRVTLEKPHVKIVAYLTHEGAAMAYGWLVEAEAWRALAQTDPDADVTLTVDRWEAATGEAIAGGIETFRFARAALTGSIYYWDISAGRIIRINDGTAEREAFMPAPPPGTDGAQCVGCHTVSNSGRWMAGRLGGGENIGAVFDLTTDLTGNPPPTVFPLHRMEPTSPRWWFSSWNPEDTRMVVSTDEGTSRALRVLDPFAGAWVSITGALPTNATHPAWSPDGTQIAYVTNVDVWGGAFTTGDIATIDVTAPDTVGSSRVIHAGSTLAGSSPGGTADSYPTWSPDSARIAFAHGTGCRSETHQAALFVMDRDGSDVVRLDRANGATTDNFQPRFSPFDQGGYFWLTFLSRRDYGNSVSGTRGAGRQQIWVTAIRKDAAPGTDPSEVPYWLPGQDTASMNISAYWAPRPCRPDGESCSVGSECCGGDCRPDEAGALVCSPPPPDRCRNYGETCSTTADCCADMGLECIGNVCINPPS